MTDTLEVFQLALGPLGANCFIVRSAERALVIDPGDEGETVLAALDEIGATAAAVLVTHGHFDHFGAVESVASASDAAVYVGARRCRPDRRSASWGRLPASRSMP